MEAITKLLENFDLSHIIPPMDTLLGKVEAAVRLAIILGPLVILGLGLIYLFAAPKEANYRLGFRTYFGMGSVEAWNFTQRIAGLSFSALGLLLTLIMGIISLTLGGKEADRMVQIGMGCMIWEVVLIGLCCLGVSIAAGVFFDKKGNRRKK